MGYVNRWETAGLTVTPAQRQVVNLIARELITLSISDGIAIGDRTGEQAGRYMVDENSITFNGVGDQSCAAFYFNWNFDASAPKPAFFGDWDLYDAMSCHCKTNREPYDAIVVAILITLDRVIEGFRWDSDGVGEDQFMVAAQALLDRCTSVDVARRTIEDQSDAVLSNIWELHQTHYQTA